MSQIRDLDFNWFFYYNELLTLIDIWFESWLVINNKNQNLA